MKAELAKRMMDSFYEARAVLELQPPLEDGLLPSYIRIIDAIHQLSEKGPVRVSDISTKLNLPKPGITRSLKQMESLGYVIKKHDDSDARTVHVELSDRGLHAYDKYVVSYYRKLTDVLSDVSEKDLKTTIAMIHDVYQKIRDAHITV